MKTSLSKNDLETITGIMRRLVIYDDDTRLEAVVDSDVMEGIVETTIEELIPVVFEHVLDQLIAEANKFYVFPKGRFGPSPGVTYGSVVDWLRDAKLFGI